MKHNYIVSSRGGGASTSFRSPWSDKLIAAKEGVITHRRHYTKTIMRCCALVLHLRVSVVHIKLENTN